MKIVKLLLILLFTSVLYSTKAQDSSTVKSGYYSVKTDLGYLAFNFFGVVNSGALTFEKAFARKHSVQLSTAFVKYIDYKSFDWSFTPEYRYFTGRSNTFNGLFIGVYTKYIYSEEKEEYNYPVGDEKYYTAIMNGYGFGVSTGLQTYFKKRIVLELLVAVGMRYTTLRFDQEENVTNTYDYDNYPNLALDGRLVINLGYKF